jgi:hypothetical protein
VVGKLEGKPLGRLRRKMEDDTKYFGNINCIILR